jgi:hypothetical protein
MTENDWMTTTLGEASCTHAEILVHLRGPGQHVRGYWSLDLLLGTE